MYICGTRPQWANEVPRPQEVLKIPMHTTLGWGLWSVTWNSDDPFQQHMVFGYCCCLRLCFHVPVCASIPSSFYLSRSGEFCSPVQCCRADTSAWKVRIHQPEHWFSGEKTSRVGARQCSTAVSRRSTGLTHWLLEDVAKYHLKLSIQNNSLSIHRESALHISLLMGGQHWFR